MPKLEIILDSFFFFFFFLLHETLLSDKKKKHPSVLLICNFSSGYLNCGFLLLNKVGSILGHVCACQRETKVG